MRRSTILSLIFCGVLLPMIARADTAEKLQAMLTTEDFKERNKLYMELRTEVGPRDLKMLAKALDDVTETQPAYYLIYLMEAADAKGAMPHLRKALEHPQGNVRTYAAQALGRQGDFSWTEKFLAIIADASASYSDRQMPISAFSNLGDMALLERLVNLVFTLPKADPPDPNADLMGDRILRSLAYRSLRQFADHYRRALNEGGPRTKSAAAVALMRLGDPSGIETLTKEYEAGAIDDSEMYSNVTYLRGVRGKRVTELLRLVLERSKMKSLTLMAIELLGDVRDRRSIPALKDLLRGEDSEIAAAAATALGRMESSELISFWEERLADDDPVQRVRAAAALVALDQTKGLPILLGALGDMTAEPAVRKEAAEVLARAACAEVVEPLLARLEDPEVEVRQAAWASLGKVFRALFPYRAPRLQDVGFNAAAAPGAQTKAIEALRQFWARRNR